jgi:hypothetical protein
MNAAAVSRTFLSIALMQILAASLSLAQVPKKGGAQVPKTGGAQLDCEKLLTAAEVGQALGLPDVTFIGDASTLYPNVDWAKNATICAYGSKNTELMAVLEILPREVFDLNQAASVLGSLPQDVQPRNVSGLGAPAKLYTGNEGAAVLVGVGPRTLAVGTGWKGRDPTRGAADAVVAIAKLVLPRLPGR